MKSLFPHCTKLIAGLSLVLLSGHAMAQSSVEEVDWQRPGYDYSKYSKVLLRNLDLDDVIVLKPVWEQDNDEEWSFEGGAGEEIQTLFRTIMADTISKDGGYEVVSEAGPDVIALEVEFLSITPYTRPGSQFDDKAGYEISTLGSGDVVLSAEFRDSESGTLLVLVEGERQIGTEYKDLSTENHIENLEETFTAWGMAVRDWMNTNTHR